MIVTNDRHQCEEAREYDHGPLLVLMFAVVLVYLITILSTTTVPSLTVNGVVTAVAPGVAR